MPLDSIDNCTLISNPDQADTDGDGAGNACDICPSAPNSAQLDVDADAVGDACDNCPGVANTGQSDADGDGMGVACETATLCCAVHTSPGCEVDSCQSAVCGFDSFCCDYTWDWWCVQQAADIAVCSCAPAEPDGDYDGVPDAVANCPSVPNSGSPDGFVGGPGPATF